jgi:hypothetical protein
MAPDVKATEVDPFMITSPTNTFEKVVIEYLAVLAAAPVLEMVVKAKWLPRGSKLRQATDYLHLRKGGV